MGSEMCIRDSFLIVASEQRNSSAADSSSLTDTSLPKFVVKYVTISGVVTGIAVVKGISLSCVYVYTIAIKNPLSRGLCDTNIIGYATVSMNELCIFLLDFLFLNIFLNVLVISAREEPSLMSSHSSSVSF